MSEHLDNPATPDVDVDPVESEQPQGEPVTEPVAEPEEDPGEDDDGYEPDTDSEPEDAAGDELPPGDSGDFDGALIEEDEAPGVAQPDEPMTREADEQQTD